MAVQATIPQHCYHYRNTHRINQRQNNSSDTVNEPVHLTAVIYNTKNSIIIYKE